MALKPLNFDHFVTTVEVVPPVGSDAGKLLNALGDLDALPIDGFSVATNPVAKPRMSAAALCTLIQQHTGRPAVLHCTTRDHNRLALQGLLWGALASGVSTVLVTTGDFVALGDRGSTTSVRDLDVFDLIAMAREAGCHVGVVLDPHPESDGLERAVSRLVRKVSAGAQFAVTQPVYAPGDAAALRRAFASIDIPVVLGILPLRTPRHAEFLHQRVAGISVPADLRLQMAKAADPVVTGIANAREMLAAARKDFAGACLMPPFDHYEVMAAILAP